MFRKILFLTFSFTIFASLAFSQVKIIFDTDHGGDADGISSFRTANR